MDDMMSKVLKSYPVEVEHDGITLRGTIRYWSKDYRVILEHPVNVIGPNKHMMYMIPAIFITPQDSFEVKNVAQRDIVERCQKELKRLYTESLDDC
jgi:hypothetical protein